jgi:hypothetical protein
VTYADFNVAEYADGLLKLTMTPSVNVGSKGVAFNLYERVGSPTPILTRSSSSGYGGGESGITVLDSGGGVFGIRAPTPEEMSGRDAGNFAYEFLFTDSGNRGPAAQGYCITAGPAGGH